jgi:hypothetical protein
MLEATSDVITTFENKLIKKIAKSKVKATSELLKSSYPVYVMEDIASGVPYIMIELVDNNSTVPSIDLLGKTYPINPFWYAIEEFDCDRDLPIDIRIELGQYVLSNREYWSL